jgi:ribonuclease HI
MPNRVIAACDGACKGNPGPAAWAWVIADADENVLRWAAGPLGRATNNVGELTALERLLMAVDPDDELEVRMDSQYAMKAVTTWLPTWKRNGWQTAGKKPVANRELVISIDALLAARRTKPTFVYVAAHQVNGDKLNDIADRAASAAAVSQRSASGTSADDVPAAADAPKRNRPGNYGATRSPAGAAGSVTSASLAASASAPAARSGRASGAGPKTPAGPKSTTEKPARAIAAKFAGRCHCGVPYQPGELITKGAVGTWGHQNCATA